MAIDGMAEEMRGGKGFADVYKWALFMTTDVIGELTFGESFKMLERGEVIPSRKTAWQDELAETSKTTADQFLVYRRTNTA